MNLEELKNSFINDGQIFLGEDLNSDKSTWWNSDKSHWENEQCDNIDCFDQSLENLLNILKDPNSTQKRTGVNQNQNLELLSREILPNDQQENEPPRKISKTSHLDLTYERERINLLHSLTGKDKIDFHPKDCVVFDPNEAKQVQSRFDKILTLDKLKSEFNNIHNEISSANFDGVYISYDQNIITFRCSPSKFYFL